ncbi:MAG TPA: hypothetical protein VH478_15455 [Trebonia sp.]|jgi:hypothetical protein|nr:hypothetical protein [Trebonia sp.]
MPAGLSTRDLFVNGARVPMGSGGTLASGTTQSSTGYTVPGTTLASLADPADLQFVFNPGNWVRSRPT